MLRRSLINMNQILVHRIASLSQFQQRLREKETGKSNAIWKTKRIFPT